MSSKRKGLHASVLCATALTVVLAVPPYLTDSSGAAVSGPAKETNFTGVVEFVSPYNGTSVPASLSQTTEVLHGVEATSKIPTRDIKAWFDDGELKILITQGGSFHASGPSLNEWTLALTKALNATTGGGYKRPSPAPVYGAIFSIKDGSAGSGLLGSWTLISRMNPARVQALGRALVRGAHGLDLTRLIVFYYPAHGVPLLQIGAFGPVASSQIEPYLSGAIASSDIRIFPGTHTLWETSTPTS
jgi:hypothetical protein